LLLNAYFRQRVAARQVVSNIPLHCGFVDRKSLSGWAICLMLCSAASAQPRCSAEAKLLVKPTETETAVAVLHGNKQSRGKVYLFDTEQADLLAQGVIVRIRTGAKNDLTVKLRFNDRGNNKMPPQAEGTLKCEADLSGDQELVSFSLGRDWNNNSVPTTGEEVYSALSAGQLRLLDWAKIAVDWHQVKRRVEVHATDWRAHPSGPLKTITIELWQWPGGTILELSARTMQGNGVEVVRQLHDLAEKNRLTIEQDQTAKTSLVLHHYE